MRKHKTVRYEVTLNPDDPLEHWLIGELQQSRRRRPYSTTLAMALVGFFDPPTPDKEKRQLYQIVRQQQKDNGNLILTLRMLVTENVALQDQLAAAVADNDQLRAALEEYGLLPGPEGQGDPAAYAGGLDLSRPRRGGSPVRAPAAAEVSEPALTPEDSARLLVQSIKGYGRHER